MNAMMMYLAQGDQGKRKEKEGTKDWSSVQTMKQNVSAGRNEMSGTMFLVDGLCFAWKADGFASVLHGASKNSV
jgi:hypothetical protein